MLEVAEKEGLVKMGGNGEDVRKDGRIEGWQCQRQGVVDGDAQTGDRKNKKKKRVDLMRKMSSGLQG